MTIESMFHPGDFCKCITGYKEYHVGVGLMIRREEQHELVKVIRADFDRERGFKYLVEFSNLERDWVKEKLLSVAEEKEVK